ncbi:unnamed protein product [Discosporangium mesarthrocarpum]
MQLYSLAGGDELESEELEWQALVIDLLEEQALTVTEVYGANLAYFTGRSIDDELAASVTGETFIFVITYSLMIAFVCTVLRKRGYGCVGNRVLLGVSGVALVLLALFAAYGINSAFGVPFTSLGQILPFILVAIGVDDMFIIVSAYDQTPSTIPVEERVGTALARSGLSITYTSLTDFVAFMLGSTASLPAVKYFCLYAAVSILFNYILQVTAFVAILAMDSRRMEAGRWDIFCCFSSSKHSDDSNIEEAVVSPQSLHHLNLSVSSVHCLLEGIRSSTISVFHPHPTLQQLWMVFWMANSYAPVLLSTPGKIIVLLGTVALLGAGIYGVTQATEGFEVMDLMPDDSYTREFTDGARKYELGLDTNYVPLAVYYGDLDYTDATVQANIQATDARMVEQTHVDGPIDSWLSSFIAWAQNTTDYSANVDMLGGYPVYTDAASFYTALSEFEVDRQNLRFANDIAREEDSTIEFCRSHMFLINTYNVPQSINALESVRDVADEAELDEEPFAFSQVFIFTEQFLVMYQELVINFVLALVAVFFLSLLILGDLQITLLVCVALVAIDVELLGFIYHWNLEINSITGIELIMAVGLVVDYMVHIVHYFLHQNPALQKEERIVQSLGEIGPSVLLGASTTLLGVIPMAFASNEIFRVFFRMFLIISGFGAYHGLVFIPVALAILPESSSSKRTASKVLGS